MGHADIATTMIYVHHVPQHDAADRLYRLVDGTPAGTRWVPKRQNRARFGATERHSQRTLEPK